MTRIVLLGDSLGMPRPSDDISYEDTYPFLLAEFLPYCTVIPRFSRARDTKFQSSEQQINDDILWLSPDIFCIHLGIVDCAPRLFSRLENNLLARLPAFIRNIIIGMMSKHREKITKYRRCEYVSSEQYEKFMSKIIQNTMSAKVIVIGIIMPPSKVLCRSYNFKANVEEYNRILLQLAKKTGSIFIDINQLLDANRHLCHDGIHLNKQGNKLLAEIIHEEIKKLR